MEPPKLSYITLRPTDVTCAFFPRRRIRLGSRMDQETSNYARRNVTLYVNEGARPVQKSLHLALAQTSYRFLLSY